MTVLKPLALATLLLLLVALAALLAHRLRHERATDRLWADLARPRGPADATFSPDLLAGLPAPATRWLYRAIAPGTPLSDVVLLRMRGTIELREGEPLPLVAEQVLAPPRGFIWRARVGSGLMRMRGYDRYAAGTGELRWWLLGIVPVVSAEGGDVDRSAAGRLAGEAALVPAALLPGRGVAWEAIDDSTCRARLHVDDETVTFTVRVHGDGRLSQVVIDRWNGDPRNGPVGVLPFVVDFEGELAAGGYTLPERLVAGWAPATGGPARPFFRVRLEAAEFR